MGEGLPRITIILRGIALFSYMVAAIVMFASSQKVHHGSFVFIAKYFDWRGFSFIAIVASIGCVYNLLILCVPAGTPLWKTIIVIDMIVNIMVGATLGAGWQTYGILRNGNSRVGLEPICCSMQFFCNNVAGSLSTYSFGFLISAVLLMYTLHVCIDPLLIGPK